MAEFDSPEMRADDAAMMTVARMTVAKNDEMILPVYWSPLANMNGLFVP